MALIQSGTHVPGVPADAFRLPPGSALRIERPARELAACMAEYYVLDSDMTVMTPHPEWMLPSWPAIRIMLADPPVRYTIGGHDVVPPVAALYGTTSTAMKVTADAGGVTIGVALTPIGWSRLFPHHSAARVRDRIVALDTLLPEGAVARLVDALRASDRGPEVKAILDGWFPEVLAPPHRDDALIAQLASLLADDDVGDVATIQARMAIDGDRLRRLSCRHFGFPPKTLLNRTRFLRSLLPMMAAGSEASFDTIAPTYYGPSHFIRDAHRYLGMTPFRFLSYDQPYVHAYLRARAAVFGAPWDAVDERAA